VARGDQRWPNAVSGTPGRPQMCPNAQMLPPIPLKHVRMHPYWSTCCLHHRTMLYRPDGLKLRNHARTIEAAQSCTYDWSCAIMRVRLKLCSLGAQKTPGAPGEQDQAEAELSHRPGWNWVMSDFLASFLGATGVGAVFSRSGSKGFSMACPIFLMVCLLNLALASKLWGGKTLKLPIKETLNIHP